MKKQISIKGIAIFAVLLIIFSVGLFLRFRMLDVKLFWFDEFLTEERSFFGFKRLLTYYMTSRVLLFSIMMKLYSFCILLVNKAKYMTEYQLRTPNVLIGSASIIVLYFSGLKIKDEITGIIAATLCALSGFLVHYSREARFYPLYFLIAILLVTAGNAIIQDSNKSKNLKPYFVYSFIALLGMYCHSGFWMLFAISNVFLVAYDLLLTVIDKGGQAFIKRFKTFLIRTCILAIPVLLVTPLFFQMYYEPRRVAHSVNEKLFSLSYDSINKISMTFWQISPWAKWIFVIVLVMGVSLCFVKKIRLVIIYLLSIKIFPFVIASLLPRQIIFEGLRATYINFVLLADIFIIALFCSTVINGVSNLLSKITRLTAFWFSLILTALIFSLLLIVKTPLIIKSDIYQPYKRLDDLVKSVKSNYTNDLYVISDDFELDFFLKRAITANLIPNDISHMLIHNVKESTKIPNDIKRILIITSGIVNKKVNGTVVKRAGKSWAILYDAKERITPVEVMRLTGGVIQSTPMYSYANFNEHLKEWRQIYPSQESSSDSLIVNGDFQDELSHWKGKSDYFKVQQEGSNNYISIQPRFSTNWITLRQFFKSNKDEVYTLSYEVRTNSYTTNKGKIFFIISDIDKKGVDTNNIYYQIETNRLNSKWKRFTQQFVGKNTGTSCLRIQTDDTDGVDIRFINFQ